MDHQEALGIGYPLEWNGRDQRLGFVTQDVQGKLSAASKKSVIDESLSLLGTYDSEQWQRDHDNLMLSIRRKDYSFGGPEFQKWLATPEGGECFLSLLLDAGGTPLNSENIRTFAIEMREKLEPLVKTIVEDSLLPKVKRQAPPARV